MTKKVHLGCGRVIKEGWINVDVVQLPGVDVVHDVEVYPWPFPDASVDEVYTKSLLEHVTDIVSVMKEIHRILKPGGKVTISVPHFTATTMYKDVTHKNFFSYGSFHAAFVNKNNHMIDFKFSSVKQKLVFGKKFAVWNYAIEWFANTFPQVYENTPLRIFPALRIIAVLRK